MAKAARSHHCHAAFQLVVRLDRHRVARHHLVHRSLLRIEPGQQHFYGAVTLGHDTDQYVVVDDQHRPDPVVTHLAQGFDDHVAGTNMDQGTTFLGQGVFDCVHRAPLVSPVLARLSGYALKVRAGSFSIDHNLAHHAAINRGAGLVRVAFLPLLTRSESSAALARSEICRSRCVGSPHDRAASATPATVKTSAAICESPSGSCSAIAETMTPITGTSIVPIAATEAGRRSTAPNQVT